MIEIAIELCDQTVTELKPLHEESCRLLAATGREPWTFEKWFENMLMFGSLPHIRGNARLMNEQTRRKYNIETE